MGRGSENILYNPPRIKKPQLTTREVIHITGQEETLLEIASLVPAQYGGFSLQKTEDEKVFVPRKLPEEASRGSFPGETTVNISEDECFSLTPVGILWSDGEEILFRGADSSAIAKPEIHTAPGEVLGLHAGDKDLFALYQDDLARILVLERGTKASGRIFNSGASQATLENKGEKSVVCFRDPKERGSLLTLHADGFGSKREMDEAASEALFQENTIENKKLENHIAPAKRDSTYFYLDDQSIRFLDLVKGENTEIARLPANALALRASADRALVLFQNRLALYDRDGLADEVAFRASEDFSFAEDPASLGISFVGDTAFLWRMRERKYLRIDIAS